jgi:hypothetical protein
MVGEWEWHGAQVRNNIFGLFVVGHRYPSAFVCLRIKGKLLNLYMNPYEDDGYVEFWIIPFPCCCFLRLDCYNPAILSMSYPWL